MRQLRVALYIDEAYKPEAGGGFTYCQNMLRAISEFDFGPTIKFILVGASSVSADQSGEHLKIKRGVRSVSYAWIKLLFSLGFKKHVQARKLRQLRYRKLEQVFKANRIDLVYYLKPEEEVLNYPYVCTHWDMSYYSSFAFPEMLYQNLDNYRRVLERSLTVICESKASQLELGRFSSCAAGKAQVVPFFTYANGEASEGILPAGVREGRYFYYPAQFWPHKNHIGLLEGFRLFLQETGSDFKLVFSGGDKGNLAYVKQRISALGLNEQVVLIGFVPRAQVIFFYQHAAAMVMPTFLGPTNLPVIEAAAVGCPVICSDLSGHREYLGNKAIYFDPIDIRSISAALVKFSALPSDAAALKPYELYKPEAVAESLKKVFEAIAPVRDQWK